MRFPFTKYSYFTLPFHILLLISKKFKSHCTCSSLFFSWNSIRVSSISLFSNTCAIQFLLQHFDDLICWSIFSSKVCLIRIFPDFSFVLLFVYFVGPFTGLFVDVSRLSSSSIISSTASCINWKEIKTVGVTKA